MASDDGDPAALLLLEHVQQALSGPLGTLNLASALLLVHYPLPRASRGAAIDLARGVEKLGAALEAWSSKVGLPPVARRSGVFPRVDSLPPPEQEEAPPPRAATRRRKWSHR